MDANQRLTELYVGLSNRRDVELPQSEPALAELWQLCDKPVLLLQLSCRLLSRQDLVLATARMVRLLSGPELETLPASLALLACSEAWARSQASPEQLAAAYALALEEYQRLEAQAAQEPAEIKQAVIKHREELAYACLSVGNLPDCVDIRQDLDQAIVNAMSQGWNHRSPEHADSLRALIPCPRLEQLRPHHFY